MRLARPTSSGLPDLPSKLRRCEFRTVNCTERRMQCAMENEKSHVSVSLDHLTSIYASQLAERPPAHITCSPVRVAFQKSICTVYPSFVICSVGHMFITVLVSLGACRGLFMMMYQSIYPWLTQWIDLRSTNRHGNLTFPASL